jgi:hypothetical protein
VTTESRQDIQARAKQSLEEFLGQFITYIEMTRSWDENERNRSVPLRTTLERRAPAITQWVLLIGGESDVRVAGQVISRGSLIATALLIERQVSFQTPVIEQYARMVENTINNTIGTIEADMWPARNSAPVLAIQDSELSERCLPLLQQGANGDTVLREATTILENRIKTSVPSEALAEILPRSADQSGEKLVNKVFSVGDPVLSVDRDPSKRDAVRKMLIGIFAYPRNEAHHHITDNTSQSWVWSVVGSVDQMLSEIESAELTVS